MTATIKFYLAAFVVLLCLASAAHLGTSGHVPHTTLTSVLKQAELAAGVKP
jgi:hypothetical protein